MSVSLKSVIDQVGKDKGLDRSVLIEALESAMLTAARKRYGQNKDIEAHYNEELGEIELFQFKDVVDEVKDPSLEISLEEARAIDPEAEIGDSLGIKLDTSELGRIAAQTAKQVIIQKVRDAERKVVYSEYKERVGELVTGIVQRFEKGDIIVNIGKGEAIFPRSEQIRRESYKQGDRLRAYILDVDKFAKGPQVILSRNHPNFLIKLFELEVPEIYERIVEIKGAAREPGERAKIAVVSNDPDVDPVGACVGVKGMRVQNVVQELKGERIDIVLWEEDPARYICNALSPAQISKVIINETEHSMEVIVPDDQLSLAIGKKGQNVRLAAKLTGWNIDILSETDAKKREDEEIQQLTRIEGLDESTAQLLHRYGYRTPNDLVSVNIDTLIKLPGLDQESAEKILYGAKRLIEEGGKEEVTGIAADGEASVEEVQGGREGVGIEAIPGVGDKTAVILKEHGYHNLQDIIGAKVEELSEIKGIGAKKAEKIKEKAVGLIKKEDNAP